MKCGCFAPPVLTLQMFYLQREMSFEVYLKTKYLMEASKKLHLYYYYY